MTERYQECEIAYASGLFEGEGSVGYYCYPSRRHKGGKHQFSAKVEMTDLEPLQRFRDAVGMGTIIGPYKHAAGTKVHWSWRTGRSDDVLRLFDLMAPYLSPRRIAQFEKAAAGWHGRNTRIYRRTA
jgi:hypothetical protein